MLQMQSSHSKEKRNNRKKKNQIAKSVFARHYLNVGDIKELVQKVNAVTFAFESDLLCKP